MKPLAPFGQRNYVVKRLQHFVVAVFASIEVFGTAIDYGFMQVSKASSILHSDVLSYGFSHCVISPFHVAERRRIALVSPDNQMGLADINAPGSHKHQELALTVRHAAVPLSDNGETMSNDRGDQSPDNSSRYKPKQINPWVQFIHYVFVAFIGGITSTVVNNYLAKRRIIASQLAADRSAASLR